jgi:uncharacterized protein (DUF2249 family)
MDASPTAAFEATAAPTDGDVERLDVRTLGPPEPLRRTMERLTDLDDGAVLVQVNDREPRHLYPRLDDRGFAHETVVQEDRVLTAIWRREP